MAEYTGHSVIFYNAAGVPTVLGGVTAMDVPTNVETISDEGGGIYDESLSITNHAPVGNVTSKSLATVLDHIPFSQCVRLTPDPEDVSQVDLIARRLSTCDDPLGATPHYQLRCIRGLLRLTTLTADRGQDATIAFVLDALTDGTNAPLAETDGVALPTGLVTAQYALGLCKLGDVVFPDLDGLSIEFQVTTTEKTPAFGSTWPDSIGVRKIQPVLTARGRDISQFKAALIPLIGTPGTHLNCLLQFTKRKNAAEFESFASPLHITATCDGLIVPENLLNSSGQARATNSLRMPLKFDGTNDPIAWNTTATYDTTP